MSVNNFKVLAEANIFGRFLCKRVETSILMGLRLWNIVWIIHQFILKYLLLFQLSKQFSFPFEILIDLLLP